MWYQYGTCNFVDILRQDKLIYPISTFLEAAFEKFFDSHMQNYIGSPKMIKGNRLDTDCKMNRLVFLPYGFLIASQAPKTCAILVILCVAF